MKRIIKIFILLVCYTGVYSQNVLSQQLYTPTKSNVTSPAPFTELSIGVASILYLINPIILYEDEKIYAGLTKELSVGFGKLGEHRIAFEYSFVFTGNISHHLRFSYKYDLLMKNNIQPSNTLQSSSVLSLGGGYFTNFNKQGLFPELTYGYSLRNHRLLIFPHVKIRHTFMFAKEDTDITDISFGIILGIANPFIDVKIRRND